LQDQYLAVHVVLTGARFRPHRGGLERGEVWGDCRQPRSVTNVLGPRGGSKTAAPSARLRAPSAPPAFAPARRRAHAGPLTLLLRAWGAGWLWMACLPPLPVQRSHRSGA
jgi:hypothetical protein